MVDAVKFLACVFGHTIAPAEQSHVKEIEQVAFHDVVCAQAGEKWSFGENDQRYKGMLLSIVHIKVSCPPLINDECAIFAFISPVADWISVRHMNVNGVTLQ